VLCGTTITSSGIARCETTVNQIGEIDGIKINRKSFGEVTGLPEPQADTIYVVSAIVAQAVSGKRDDVYVVDDTIRNEQGQIVGCNALAQI
jgi:hypothetical protein